MSRFNVIQFKPKQQIVDLAIVNTHSTILNDYARLTTTKDRVDYLLVTVSTLCYMLFDLNVYQDPRVTVCGGIKELYNRWCRKVKRQ